MFEVLKALGRDFNRRLHPWQIVAICTLAYVVSTLICHNWDPMSFAIVGGRFDPGVSGDSLGYDGQFAYQIARAPLESSRYLDAPAYRYQRILYPLLARLLSLGNATLLPWMLILINLVALPAGTALTERILAHYDVSRWYAITYGLYIGLLMPVRLDLTEPLAYLLVQAGVLAFSRRQSLRSAVWFMLAALARETTLLFAAAYVVYLITSRRWWTAFKWGALVAAPFLVWQGVLRVWLGSWGIGSGGALSTPFEIIPFHGWWGIARLRPVAFAMMSLLVVPLALLPAVLSIWASLRALWHKHWNPATLALLANAVVFPFLPTSNVLDPLGLSRVTAGLVVAVLNFGARQRRLRTLNYALLWITTAIFVCKDSFLPRS